MNWTKLCWRMDHSLCYVFQRRLRAHFVDGNRDRNQSVEPHCYDVVCGPIADDGVAYSLGRYHEGTMTIEELAATLQDKFLDQQVMIGSQRALSYLKKIKTEQI